MKEEIELQRQLDASKAELVDAQQLISFLTDERSGLQLQLRKLEVFSVAIGCFFSSVQNLPPFCGLISFKTLLLD